MSDEFQVKRTISRNEVKIIQKTASKKSHYDKIDFLPMNAKNRLTQLCNQILTVIKK